MVSLVVYRVYYIKELSYAVRSFIQGFQENLIHGKLHRLFKNYYFSRRVKCPKNITTFYISTEFD